MIALQTLLKIAVLTDIRYHRHLRKHTYKMHACIHVLAYIHAYIHTHIHACKHRYIHTYMKVAGFWKDFSLLYTHT